MMDSTQYIHPFTRNFIIKKTRYKTFNLKSQQRIRFEKGGIGGDNLGHEKGVESEYHRENFFAFDYLPQYIKLFTYTSKMTVLYPLVFSDDV